MKDLSCETRAELHRLAKDSDLYQSKIAQATSFGALDKMKKRAKKESLEDPDAHFLVLNVVWNGWKLDTEQTQLWLIKNGSQYYWLDTEGIWPSDRADLDDPSLDENAPFTLRKLHHLLVTPSGKELSSGAAFWVGSIDEAEDFGGIRYWSRMRGEEKKVAKERLASFISKYRTSSTQDACGAFAPDGDEEGITVVYKGGGYLEYQDIHPELLGLRIYIDDTCVLDLVEGYS